MLCLSVKPEGRVVITASNGEQIVILNRDKSLRYRLGFEAPPSVSVIRTDAIERQKEKAAREMTPEFDGCEGP